MLDNGNFPLWLTDFFPKHRRDCSRHAHILDFDVLRLGRKVLENNLKAGSFEFGVVAITERGNNLELKEVKKGSDETNQKNDLFNSWLKMCRHSATVDNFPFIKVFTDEQRPESWGADARDLADIINIASCGEPRLALSFYTIEEMLSEWAFNRFLSLYYDFRFRRGDNTLLVHILKGITAWLWRRNLRIYNRFGYSILKIEKERGTMDGKTENRARHDGRQDGEQKILSHERKNLCKTIQYGLLFGLFQRYGKQKRDGACGLFGIRDRKGERGGIEGSE